MENINKRSLKVFQIIFFGIISIYLLGEIAYHIGQSFAQ